MVNSVKSSNYVESQRKRSLGFLYDYEFSTRPFTWTFYGMELNRKRNLRIEIYKTSNTVKFEFMKEIFSFRQSNKAI